MNTKNFQISEQKTDSKEADQPTNHKESSPMKTIKKFNPFDIKRITRKTTSKIASNNRKLQPFSSLSSKVSKAIWGLSLLLSCNLSFAANADGYAFTGVLFKLMNELEGAPIALITAIGIIAAGFIWIFKGHDVGIKQVISALVGGGLVIAAPTLVLMVPGMSGAVI